MHQKGNNSEQRLNNIVIIRPILIFLLVFYHSFAIYSGSWKHIDGFPEIKTYYWLNKLSYAFMLEMFVFISGYVFGFQVRTKGLIKIKAKNLIWGKFKRLIIPSIIFSIFYVILFGDIHQPFAQTIYEILNGVGHMWFLPMLFWCFIGIWIIEKLCLKPNIITPFLFLCSILYGFPLPLRISASMYYMLFFYVGYFLQRNQVSLTKYFTTYYVLALALLFIILFPSLTILSESISNIEEPSQNYRFLAGKFSHLAKIIYASIGLAMLLCMVGVAEQKRTSPIPKWVDKIGSLCMGAYLFQQFILVAIYYYTFLPNLLGPIWLPWVSFIIALIGSFAISYQLRKTKIGRILIS